MIRIQRLGCALVLIGIAGLVAYSQEKGSEYVSRRKPLRGAKRPRCKFNC